MDSHLRKQALLESLELNRQWYESGNVKGERLDLSDTDLRGANIARADLTDANLSQVKLINAKLSHADFSGSDMSQAAIVWQDLTKANVTAARERILRRSTQNNQRG